MMAKRNKLVSTNALFSNKTKRVINYHFRIKYKRNQKSNFHLEI